jgi:predicted transcriptional regulator of viral defense system
MSNITKKILELASTDKTVFMTADLAIIWKVEDKNILRVTISRAMEKGYLESIRRGVYKLKDREVNALELAGKLKKRSYVSFETILAQAGVIFQWYDEIVSASDRNHTEENSYGKFSYRKIPDNILLNNKGIINKGNYFIATPERAFCDKIYKDGLSYFDSLSEISAKEMIEMSKIYKNKRLGKDIKKLFSL